MKDGLIIDECAAIAQIEKSRLMQMTDEPAAFLWQGAQRVFTDRIRDAPPTLIHSLTKSKSATSKLWDFGHYVLFAVTAPKNLAQFDRFESKFGSPFPNLIKRGTQSSIFRFQGKNFSIGEMTLKTNAAAVVELEPDSTMWLHNVAIDCEARSQRIYYKIDLVCLIRFGDKIPRTLMEEILDGMVLKHIFQTSDYDFEYV